MTDVNASGRTAAGDGGRRPRERAWIVATALVAAAGMAAYAGWRHYARPVDPRYQAVIELLARDPSALPPVDDHGRTRLTGRFVGLTPRDEMVVDRRSDGSFLALFPTFYGKGATLAGLLYASRPLGDADTAVREATLGRTERTIRVGSYGQAVFDHRIDDHWYQVSYGLR